MSLYYEVFDNVTASFACAFVWCFRMGRFYILHYQLMGRFYMLL